MALIQINQADMPAPSSLTVRLTDVRQSVRRALDGTACVSRAGVQRVITCAWNYLTRPQLTLLLAAATQHASFLFSYPDPATGEARQMTAVCSDRSVGLLRNGSNGPVWTNVRLTLNEV